MGRFIGAVIRQGEFRGRPGGGEFFLSGGRPAYTQSAQETVNAVTKPPAGFAENFHPLFSCPPGKAVSLRPVVVIVKNNYSLGRRRAGCVYQNRYFAGAGQKSDVPGKIQRGLFHLSCIRRNQDKPFP